MEKDQTEEQEPNTLEAETTEAVIPQNDHETAEPEVIIKKTGGGLSLLLSLLALAAAAYVLYQNWQDNQQADVESVIATINSKVQESNQELRQDLTRSQAETQRLNQQLTSLQQALADVENLAAQPQPVAESEPFDNSGNEQLIQQLRQQLTDQAQSIARLQDQIRQMPVSQETPSLSPMQLSQFQNAATIQMLLTVQTLLDTQQLAAAQAAVQRYLNTNEINAEANQQLQRLSQQIADIEVPDPAPLRQTLQSLSTTVKSLQLPTVEADADEDSWYDRFISVKKIDESSNLGTSAQLLALQAQLDRLLYQAEINLSMQHQSGWQDVLNQAAQLLQQELPQQQDLVARIHALANAPIRAVVPADVNVTGLIQVLKGSNP